MDQAEDNVANSEISIPKFVRLQTKVHFWKSRRCNYSRFLQHHHHLHYLRGLLRYRSLCGLSIIVPKWLAIEKIQGFVDFVIGYMGRNYTRLWGDRAFPALMKRSFGHLTSTSDCSGLRSRFLPSSRAAATRCGHSFAQVCAVPRLAAHRLDRVDLLASCHAIVDVRRQPDG